MRWLRLFKFYKVEDVGGVKEYGGGGEWEGRSVFTLGLETLSIEKEEDKGWECKRLEVFLLAMKALAWVAGGLLLFFLY